MLGNLFGSSQFSRPTVKEFESALLHNVYDMLEGHRPLTRFLCTVCVLRYLAARKSSTIYKNHGPFISQITREVAEFVVRNLASVRIYKAFVRRPLGRFISAGWWFSQPLEHQKKIASHILLSTSKPGMFFDTRMLSETDSPVAQELLEGQNDFDVWLLNEPDSRNSVEDIAMAITEFLIADGFKENKPPAHSVLHPFIKRWLTGKKRKQQSRVQKSLLLIEKSMTATRLLNRIQLGLPLDRGDAKKLDETSVQSLSILPDLLYDTMLSRLLSPEMREMLHHFPAKMRSKALCIVLQRLLRAHESVFTHVPEDIATFVTKRYKFRLLFSSQEVSAALDRGLDTLCAQSNDAIRSIIDTQIRHIQKLKFLSPQDRLRMQRWSINYRLAQAKLENNFTPERLYSNNPVLGLYIRGRDKGATAGRLRTLFESLLGQEPKHDVFHQHLQQLSELFELWPDNHAQVLNKIIGFLQSQIGGSQKAHLQFHHWNRFRQLAKGATVLSRSTYHNLQDAVELSAMDPQSVAKFQRQLKQDRFIIQDPEVDLLKTACAMGLVDAVPGYVKAIQKSPYAYEIPAIDHLITSRLGDLHIEIRPHHDLVGIMGVASHGVCIRFGGDAHMSHWNNAVAHLIVRDDEKIWLWGLLLREQRHTATPQYFLNNLQGALPSRYAKQKEQVAGTIRMVLSSIGHVFFKDLFFNAISLKTDELAKSMGQHRLQLPSLRLDISNYRKGVDGVDSTLCVINEPTMVLCKPDSSLPEFDQALYGTPNFQNTDGEQELVDEYDYDDVT
jgi:hypothetical protein